MTSTSASAPIQHIVFDVGRVLLHWDPELAYLDLIEDEEERAHFLTEICSPSWNLQQDLGRSWREAEDELITVHPDKEDLIRAYRGHWHKMVPHAYDRSVEILNGLMSDGHDVTLLTNFNQDTFSEAQERFPVLTSTRGVTVSGEIGLIKPDRAIFDHHCEAFSLNGSTTLFFDDSPKNVEGARQAGWQAELFTDPDKLADDLHAYGFRPDLPSS